MVNKIDLNKYTINNTMNYYFYEIKINLILLHIYINLKKRYNNNQSLLKDKFNIIVHLIKRYIHNHFDDVKINILLNLVIYKFLKYITITNSHSDIVLN